ncbi:DUF262 domain-containing HNH endonuclease family protein [Prolixibacteraceae bacterium]|nr:DUF262 domain-containing HNH endonuclease family protein [Prolixibacteraceae bacterium]
MKHTPENISDKTFSIPLYQRLFEWEEQQILQLLEDLYSSFKKDDTAPYYIGMLTVYEKNGIYSLVDGQQRFTVLTLLSIYFEWKDFTLCNDKPRLQFDARPKDQAYLQAKIEEKTPEVSNRKMEDALQVIENFFNQFVDDKKVEFGDYIKTQTTFFISKLPKSYSLQDLNHYFEAMNEAGKGLQNHEILKVALLKKVSENYTTYTTYTQLWNDVSDMSKTLLRSQNGETLEKYSERYLKSIKKCSITNYKKRQIVDTNNIEEFKSIKDIEKSSTKPETKENEEGDRAILSFPEFLLQVLWLSIEKDQRKNSTEFFNSSKLLETFNRYMLSNEANIKVSTFFENLLKYRLLFDYFVIRLNSESDYVTNYSLHMVVKDSTENKDQLIQYQSMLYVSLQYHMWLTPLLENRERNYKLDYSGFITELKEWDNERVKLNSQYIWKEDKQSLNKDQLSYQNIQRYWFWRLDYYLWENRADYFKNKEMLEVANKYLFKQNRSIEHVAPQHPQKESQVKIDEDHLHSFGNLAMISSGQNSSLQNESYEIKRAHIDAFINQSRNGNVESLKLLKIMEEPTWDNEKLKKHEKEMIELLEESFIVNTESTN